MSSQYSNGLKRIIDGNISLLNDTLKFALVDNDLYSVDLDDHEYLSDISPSALVSISAPISGKAVNIDSSLSPHQIFLTCSNAIFTAVSGNTTESIVLFKETGNSATSPLIAYYNGVSSQLSPSGNDVDLIVGPSGILRWSR
jgi:hypothetical protein